MDGVPRPQATPETPDAEMDTGEDIYAGSAAAANCAGGEVSRHSRRATLLGDAQQRLAPRGDLDAWRAPPLAQARAQGGEPINSFCCALSFAASMARVFTPDKPVPQRPKSGGRSPVRHRANTCVLADPLTLLSLLMLDHAGPACFTYHKIEVSLQKRKQSRGEVPTALHAL